MHCRVQITADGVNHVWKQLRNKLHYVAVVAKDKENCTPFPSNPSSLEDIGPSNNCKMKRLSLAHLPRRAAHSMLLVLCALNGGRPELNYDRNIEILCHKYKQSRSVA